MVYVLDFDIAVSEFKLQLLCGIHIWTNALGKGKSLLIYPALG